MSKTKTRLLLIIFSLLIVGGFSYTVLKAEDLKEKESLIKYISTENSDYAKYRKDLIDQMGSEKEKYKKEMQASKEQYYDLLAKQDIAIKQHTKQVAVVSKKYVASNQTVTTQTSSSSNSSSSSTTKTTAKPAPVRSTKSS